MPRTPWHNRSVGTGRCADCNQLLWECKCYSPETIAALAAERQRMEEEQRKADKRLGAKIAKIVGYSEQGPRGAGKARPWWRKL